MLPLVLIRVAGATILAHHTGLPARPLARVCVVPTHIADDLATSGLSYWEEPYLPRFAGRPLVLFTNRRTATGDIVVELRSEGSDPSSVCAEGSIPAAIAYQLVPKGRAGLVRWEILEPRQSEAQEVQEAA